jgi:hypothetical protein
MNAINQKFIVVLTRPLTHRAARNSHNTLKRSAHIPATKTS